MAETRLSEIYGSKINDIQAKKKKLRLHDEGARASHLAGDW